MPWGGAAIPEPYPPAVAFHSGVSVPRRGHQMGLGVMKGSWRHGALRQTACQASDGGGTDGLLRPHPGWACLPCLGLWSRGQAGASEAPASGRRNGGARGIGRMRRIQSGWPWGRGPTRRQSPSAHCSLWGALPTGPGPPRGHMGTSTAGDTGLLCQSWQERDRGSPWGEGPCPSPPGPGHC